MKDNGMIDGQDIFDQPVKIAVRIYDNIWKNAIAQGDDCRTSYLLDYPDFKENCKLIAVDLSKLDGDLKAM